MQIPEIQLQNISKSYGENQVLEDFSLDVERGEFVVAIGSSGCGKTTVLKLINGLLTPDSGAVTINGKNISELDQNRLRRQIGYVIQGIGLFPHLKVRDNIAYVLNLEKTDKAYTRKRTAELLELVRLDQSVLLRYPHQLSGGQKQRVGIARALAASPKILLMDEPFGAVDDINRKLLQKELKKIHQELGITIFFITHDIQEAMVLATRIAVMDYGKILQFDTPEKIRENPACDFVRTLIAH